jgi:hypothetical protein
MMHHADLCLCLCVCVCVCSVVLSDEERVKAEEAALSKLRREKWKNSISSVKLFRMLTG